MSAGKSGTGSLRELCLIAILAALMFGTQVAMASIPNVHLVAVFIILAATLFGWKALYSVFIFIMLEGLMYGFGLWFLSYLYIWPLLAIVAVLCRKNTSRIFWAVVAGIFGLIFGALCSIPYFLAGGWAAGVAYWVAGIPYDFIHCVSNAVLTFFLITPMQKLCMKLLGRRGAPVQTAIKEGGKADEKLL
jgi:energy-coupling factor transport system substrate-specific component